MAFVVATKDGRYEVRESRSTPNGPRSKTLAGFRELDDEVIRKARERASNPPSAEQLRRAARRAGAPVARRPVDQAARELIAALSRGERLSSPLRRILPEMLNTNFEAGDRPAPSNEAAHSMAAWMAASPEERGRTLFELLLLADALPSGGRKHKPLRFPRLNSSGDRR